MFKNVLVGVDGRNNGRDAVALADQLVAADGKLTLAHVHSGALRPSTAITPGLARDEAAAADQLLADEREATGVDAELANVVAATTGRGLHEEAERRSADLLVVGSSSRGLIGRALIGDDARGALNGAPCAVAIAARGYGGQPAPFVKIGIGYDASPESEAALELAREIGERTGAELHALSVASIPAYVSNGLVAAVGDEMVGALLDDATEKVTSLDGVEGTAVIGIASEELALFSAGMDLLVVGSRGYGPLRRMMLGSTSAVLQRHARCSLLVLPRRATHAPD
jgi:nucleotide-binding universal stress UspA family protein